MNHFAAGRPTNLPATFNTGEDRGQSVIVILRPSIERMVVTVRTTQSHTHQQFTGVFRLCPRIPNDKIEVGGTILVRVSLGQ